MMFSRKHGRWDRMKLSREQRVVCKLYSSRDSNGLVHCSQCPMLLDKRDCVCLKNVSREHAIRDYDWDGSPYPRLKGVEK